MKINTKMFSSLNYRSMILGVVMFASILAFLFTGFGRLQVFNFKGMDPNIALTVGNQTVDMSEFANIMAAQGLSNSTPENQRKYMAFQVLTQLVDQKLMIEEAEKMGFDASHADVASFIRSIKAFQDPSTGQFSFDLLKKYLGSRQLNEVEFFRSIQGELTAQNLSQLMLLKEVYPTNLAKTQYMMEHTEFNLQYALVNINPTFGNEQAKTQVDEFLKNPANQKQLEDLYQSHYSQYNQKTRYKVLSILVADKDSLRAQGDALQRNKLDAQKLSDSLLIQIQDGADFNRIAAQTNDDIQAKQSKGDLGYIDESNIDPESFIAVSQLSLDKPLSSVVETPYGFRIFKLIDKKEGFSIPLENVKSTLAQELIAKQLTSSLQNDFENKVTEALNKKDDPSALNTLLATQAITWQSMSKPFTIKDGAVVELGSASPLTENVFYLHKPGDVIPKILDFGTSKRAIVKLVSIRKADNPTIADIDTLRKQNAEQDSREFMDGFMKSWKESYEKKNKIKMNPILIP